jgi:hypothetical protein
MMSGARIPQTGKTSAPASFTIELVKTLRLEDFTIL